jgi:hypothetical protein
MKTDRNNDHKIKKEFSEQFKIDVTGWIMIPKLMKNSIGQWLNDEKQFDISKELKFESIVRNYENILIFRDNVYIRTIWPVNNLHCKGLIIL